MINLKFNPETVTLLVKEGDLGEIVKSLGGTKYKFVPPGSDDLFTGTVTLPIRVESSPEDKEGFINFLVGLISTNPEYADENPLVVKEKLQKLWLENYETIKSQVETKEETEIIVCQCEKLPHEEFLKKCPLAVAILGTKEK